jgi:hypothetical protein
MAEISKDFGYGGANLCPLDSAGTPTLAEALRDVADDFTTMVSAFQVSSIATISTADASDQATLNALTIAIKSAMVAVGFTVSAADATDLATSIALVNELKADLVATGVVEIPTANATNLATGQTLANVIKAKLNGGALSITIKTVKI